MALGGTITELQSRMTVAEVGVWMAYRNKYGAMNDVRRYDRPAALVGSIIAQVHGGKTKQSDLMPFGKNDTDTTFDDFVTALGSGVVIGKRG